MRNSQDVLAATHHLRHGARMQYGLFLKVLGFRCGGCWGVFFSYLFFYVCAAPQGIGLTLEEALLFWRSEFARTMTVEQV
jgi:DNA primase large subunit